jgi:hypothetical protein
MGTAHDHGGNTLALANTRAKGVRPNAIGDARQVLAVSQLVRLLLHPLAEKEEATRTRGFNCFVFVAILG